MPETSAQRPITHARVALIALPVVLSNATVPLQGVIDTAIIGNLGDATILAAVTLGATFFSLLVNLFNFLQIGVSGLAAQALGAGDGRRVLDTLVRALIVAAAIALLLNLAGPLVARGGLALFEGSAEAEAMAASYIRIRLLGAPAELANYALIGWFTGQELTRRLFEMQLAISLTNVGLNLVFVLGLGWGIEGVAAGTAIGAYAGLALGAWRARRRLGVLMPGGVRLDWARILRRAELERVLALNRDIFVRTLCLTGSFAWMARLGSLQGDVVLAANGVLMQFLYVSAYALDGVAMAAETLVGQALGASDRGALRRAVAVTFTTAAALAVAMAAAASVAGEAVVTLLTNVEAVREVARAHLLWATLIPVAGVAAYQLDGVFVGAADGRGMRNAMLVSAGIFVPLGWALTQALGNHGLWLALWLWMAARAVTLLLRYPALEARAAGERRFSKDRH